MKRYLIQFKRKDDHEIIHEMCIQGIGREVRLLINNLFEQLFTREDILKHYYSGSIIESVKE